MEEYTVATEYVKVEAESKLEAVEKMKQGEGEEVEADFLEDVAVIKGDVSYGDGW